jgi:phage baseplate assembly protein W
MNEQLKTKNWQHKLGTIGGVVVDLDDIGQCYEVIFATTKGSIPFNPDLGLDLIDFIDGDMNISLLKKHITEELNRQEPRASVVGVDVNILGFGSAAIKVRYNAGGIISEKEVRI